MEKLSSLPASQATVAGAPGEELDTTRCLFIGWMINLSSEAAQQLRELLRGLGHPVRVLFFSRQEACAECPAQKDLLDLVTSSGDKQVTLETWDLDRDAELARYHGVERAPATVVLGRENYGLRFFGLTGGHEFPSLIHAIRLAADGPSVLDPQLQKLASLITAPTHLEVMVSLTCPWCPKVVQLAHELAVANPNIRADMVDISEFPELAERYQVRDVPRMVVNERPSFHGAIPPGEAVMEILKVANPESWERLDALLREVQGERKVHEPRSGETYDVLIVGAGPAAYSAAVYAARKGMQVALIGDAPGGQLLQTALVENWPGVPQVDARDLAEALRRQIEQYPIAEALRVKVSHLVQTDGGFEASTSDGRTFRARSVIWCAGKEYRRLGVPGEEKFLGNGIAFCATCDAPLFVNKRVAVIGGGNSAFTAARDLLHYASEIHLVTRGSEFRADPVLQQEVTRSPKVKVHRSTQVLDFLGDHRLVGMRIESLDGRRREELPIDGAFLEIGLIPNTHPLEGFVTLNSRWEVPVDRNQATPLPGFFAAGDVTDEPEKQLVVAAASGAKAAVSAWEYLQQSGLHH